MDKLDKDGLLFCLVVILIFSAYLLGTFGGMKL